MNLEELKERNRQTFSQESEDLLQDLDDALLHLEASPDNLDLVNRVFRSMHTLKGSGATVGFKDLADFLHHVEDAFNAVREGKIPVTSELVDVALKSCDIVRAYLAGKDEQECAENLKPAAAIVEQVKRLLPHADGTPGLNGNKANPKPETEERSYPVKIYRVRFRPHSSLFFSGTDPVSLLNELRGLGAARVRMSDRHLPTWEEFNPEHSYLAWEIQIATEGGESALRDVFMFVEDECDLEIIPVPYAEAEDIPAGIYFDEETIKGFTVESEEHMQVMEEKLLLLEKEPAAKEPCDPLFRSLHNLKGVCRLLISESIIPLPSRHPLRWLGILGHAVEGIVEKHRDEGSAFDSEGIQTLLETIDLFRKLLHEFESGSCQISPNPILLSRLGIDPADVASDRDGTPKLKLDPAHRVFAQAFSQSQEVLEELITASKEGKELKGLKDASVRALKTLHHMAIKIGDKELAGLIDKAAGMVASDSFPPEGFDSILLNVWNLANEKLGISEIKPVEKSVSTVREPSAGQTNGQSRSIRVDTDKLDRLMRAVGELLVARNTFPLLAEKAELEHGLRNFSKDIKDAGVHISHIADDLQASIMAIRMMPVKNVFQKFPRMVRDMAQALGKQVELVLEGEETELDKTVLDQIGDPLVHLVRNAVDHGIEKSEIRGEKSKRTAGKVALRAFNRGSNVIIEIEDDGRGMDAEKLKAKAVEKKLITEEKASAMTEQQAFELIFLAGFSTAEKITDVSGRGVGMDVVRSNIETLCGTVGIQSRLGEGSKFSMILPTSLLVSKGILIQAGGTEYILPMQSVVEMIKMPKERIRQLPSGRVAQVRKEVLPVLSLEEALGAGEDKSFIENHYKEDVAVAIIRVDRGLIGIMVDNFVNQVEVIVKPLTGGLAGLNAYEGATIMGDGRVVLVLNVKAL